MAENVAGSVEVEVRARLDSLERGLEQARMQLQNFDKAAAKPLQNLRGLEIAARSIQMQLIALAGNLGLVGTALAGFGPAGLAAAAGIGAVVAVFRHVSEQSSRFGEASSSLINFSRNAGLTAIQMRALQIAGADAGVGAEALATRFTRFTFSLDAAHKATGPLYEAIQRVDAGLADQLSRTKTVADAWDILAKALARGTSASAALATSAFGRGGAGMIPIAQMTEAAGGLAAYIAKQKESLGVSEQEVKVANDLKSKIDELRKTNELLYQKLFAVEVLARAKEFEAALGSVLRSMNELKKSDQMTWMDKFKTFTWNVTPSWLITAEDEANLKAWQKKLQDKIDQAPLRQSVVLNFTTQPVPGAAGILPGGKFAPDPVDIDKATRAYNILKAAMDILGAGASSTQRITLETLRLAAAVEATGGKYADVARTALAVFKETEQLGGLSARIGLLGLMATSTDINTQSQLQLNAANRQGANVYGEQARLLKEANVLRAEGARQAAAAEYGLISATAMLNQKNAEYLNLARQLGLSNEQLAAGYEIVARRAREAWEASQVAASRMPNFTRASFDALNFDKALDTLATNGIDGLASALNDVAMGNKSLEESFRALTLNVLAEFNKMIIKALLFKAIQESMGLGGGGGGGFSILSLLGLGGGGGGGLLTPTGEGHSGAIIGGSGKRRYVHPAYFESAPRMHSGGKINWGAGERPFIGKVGEEVGWPSKLAAKYGDGSGRATLQQKVTINNYGAEVSTSQDDSGNMEITVRAVARDEMASSRTNAINWQKYGQRPQLRQRRGA